MTLIALLTGAIWGQPIWGTWWVWDPRLTSFLILFLFYLGYMALWSAIDNDDTAADLTSILCLVGSVFALLSRYAVLFWNQGLHQDGNPRASHARALGAGGAGMIPDLGKYAAYVLSAYGVSLALIVALVWVSVWRARR
ncbi:unnamed protein product, partial [Cyprideis torosa]